MHCTHSFHRLQGRIRQTELLIYQSVAHPDNLENVPQGPPQACRCSRLQHLLNACLVRGTSEGDSEGGQAWQRAG